MTDVKRGRKTFIPDVGELRTASLDHSSNSTVFRVKNTGRMADTHAANSHADRDLDAVLPH